MAPPASPASRAARRRPRPRGRALAAAVAALAAACAAPPLPESAPLDPALARPDDARRTLAAGDVVRVDVFGHAELSTGELGRRVDGSGDLDLPLLGAVPVAGRTVAEARDAIEERAARYLRRPSVAVGVVEWAPRTVYVLGAVRQGGAYPLAGPTNALQALALAGGFAPEADRGEVALLRVEEDALVVHVFDAATPGPDGLAPVRPDDIVFVRHDGAGTFREEVLPYIQGVAPPASVAASLLLLGDD